MVKVWVLKSHRKHIKLVVKKKLPSQQQRFIIYAAIINQTLILQDNNGSQVKNNIFRVPSGASPSHLGQPEARPQWPRYGLTASWRLPHTSLSLLTPRTLLTPRKLSPYDHRLRYNMLPPLPWQHHRPYLFTKADWSDWEKVFLWRVLLLFPWRYKYTPFRYSSTCYVILMY